MTKGTYKLRSFLDHYGLPEESMPQAVIDRVAHEIGATQLPQQTREGSASGSRRTTFNYAVQEYGAQLTVTLQGTGPDTEVFAKVSPTRASKIILGKLEDLAQTKPESTPRQAIITSSDDQVYLSKGHS